MTLGQTPLFLGHSVTRLWSHRIILSCKTFFTQLKHQSLSAQLLYDSQFDILPFLSNDVSEWKKNKWQIVFVFENAIKCTGLNIQSIRRNPISNRKSCHCICFQTSPGQHTWRSQFKPITMRLATDQSQHGRVETDARRRPAPPTPALSASSGRHHGANDGVAVRVFHVFSGGAHHRSVRPGPLSHAAPPESPLPGRDGPLPAGAAVQGRRRNADRARPRYDRGVVGNRVEEGWRHAHGLYHLTPLWFFCVRNQCAAINWLFTLKESVWV